jgi:type III restriction enzyme
MMKLHFEPNLDYQHAAIEAVCDLFRGQETCRTEFTVTHDSASAQQRMGFVENDLGIGNRLTLLDDELLKNLHDIQLRNGLPPSADLASGDFTVEMERFSFRSRVAEIRNDSRRPDSGLNSRPIKSPNP